MGTWVVESLPERKTACAVHQHLGNSSSPGWLVCLGVWFAVHVNIAAKFFLACEHSKAFLMPSVVHQAWKSPNLIGHQARALPSVGHGRRPPAQHTVAGSSLTPTVIPCCNSWGVKLLVWLLTCLPVPANIREILTR